MPSANSQYYVDHYLNTFHEHVLKYHKTRLFLWLLVVWGRGWWWLAAIREYAKIIIITVIVRINHNITNTSTYTYLRDKTLWE